VKTPGASTICRLEIFLDSVFDDPLPLIEAWLCWPSGVPMGFFSPACY
jgi:hypothetical protein